MNAPRYAVVTVTLDPDAEVLRRQLDALAPAPVVIVDNGSAPAARAAVRALAAAQPGRTLVQHERNEGLARALNAGARVALEQDPASDYLVFLDDDTEPGPGGIERLVRAVQALRDEGRRVGLAGPLVVDADSGLGHGVPVIRGWRWTRVFPRADDVAPVPCAAINGSGSVVPSAVFRELGGFDDALFVDHIDTEWSFRVAHAGYQLYTLPAVRLPHRMGERSVRYWLGRTRLWPYRTAARHFYIFRNVVRLLRRPYVPLGWKLAAPFKLALTFVVHAIADPARGAQVGAMLRGLRAGISA